MVTSQWFDFTTVTADLQTYTRSTTVDLVALVSFFRRVMGDGQTKLRTARYDTTAATAGVRRHFVMSSQVGLHDGGEEAQAA